MCRNGAVIYTQMRVKFASELKGSHCIVGQAGVGTKTMIVHIYMKVEV